MFNQGDRVFHEGHGEGEIIEVRIPITSNPVDYLLSDRGTDLLPRVPAEIMVNGFYDANRYPYRVRFPRSNFTGGEYTDVYSLTDLRPL